MGTGPSREVLGGAVVAVGALSVLYSYIEKKNKVLFDFDTPVERGDLYTVKHGLAGFIYNTPVWNKDDINGALPLWVADMEFPVCPGIGAKIQERAQRETFGYTYQPSAIWEGISSWMKRRHNWVVSPESFIFSASVVRIHASAEDFFAFFSRLRV